MRNAFLVALREYVENAKTKGFWMGIFMLPIVLFLSFQVPMLLEKKGAPVRHFVLLDYSGGFGAIVDRALDERHHRNLLVALNDYARDNGVTLPAALKPFDASNAVNVSAFLEQGGKDFYLRTIQPLLPARAPEFVEPRRLYRRVEMSLPPTLEAATSELRAALNGEKSLKHEDGAISLDAAIILPRDLGLQSSRSSNQAPASIQYWSRNLADKSLRAIVEEVVNSELRRREYMKRGLDPALFTEIENSRTLVQELNPRKAEGQEQVSRAETFAQWAPVGFVYLLWVALFSISQMLLTNTIEEKSNRIIEVLLSSVTPAEFVLGKLAGIAAVGLTMVFAWLGSFAAIVSWKAGGQSEFASQVLAQLHGSHLLPAFVIYFFFGYLLYAGIILSIGSVCNTLKEAQNYMGVITMLMMVPLLTMMFIPKDPNGTVATVLSWIPIYTPFIMMNRAAADPPMFDVIGTMLLLIVCTILTLWGAVKIFRIGILRTGQPPRIIEMIRWLRAD